MKYLLIYILLIGLFLECNAQNILLSLNGVSLEISCEEYEDGSLILSPIIKNRSGEDIYIDKFGIKGKIFSVSEIIYLNFGSMINSIQHPYLPLEHEVSLKRIIDGLDINLEPIIITEENRRDRIRLGIDFIFDSRLKRKPKQSELIHLSAEYYRKQVSYSFVIVDL